MKTKQKIFISMFLIAVMSFCVIFSPVSQAYSKEPECFAADPGICCGGVKTIIIECPDDADPTMEIVKLIIKVLTASIGIAAVGGIIFGSILYVISAGNAEQVKKARTIIINVVIGLVVYGLLFSIVNFLIPGGILT